MNYLLFTAILFACSCTAKVVDDIIEGEVKTIEAVVKDEIACPLGDPSPIPEPIKRPMITFCQRT